METQTVSETIAAACRIRPVFSPMLETFEPILTQRRATAEKLAPLLVEAGIRLPETAGERPMLAEKIPGALGGFIILAARDILPLLLKLTVMIPYKAALEKLFLDSGNERLLEDLLAATLSDSPDALIRLAEKAGLEPHVLDFASSFIISAVLRALALQRKDDEFPDWRKGICPVCGTAPVIAWLGKKPRAENNEFLASGGGKKHLHCGMCGADWYFLRGICPSCGAQGQDAMQILGEEDRRHERVDWCKKCQCYLPQIDLRELADVPDMDAMALCLAHLDIAASEKGLEPLKPSFWNMF